PPIATETTIIGRKAGIAITGSFSLPHRNATLIGARFPTAAADYSLNIFAGVRRTGRIGSWTFFVVGWTVNILTPLRYVSVQIINPKSIWLFLAARVSLLFRVFSNPAILPK